MLRSIAEYLSHVRETCLLYALAYLDELPEEQDGHFYTSMMLLGVITGAVLAHLYFVLFV